MTDFETQYKDMEREVKKLTKELETAESLLADKNAQLDRFNEQISAATNEKIKVLQSKMVELEEVHDQLNLSLLKTKTNLDESLARNESRESTFLQKEEELQSEISSLQGELKTASSKNNNLKAKLVKAETDNCSNEKKISELEKVLTSLDETLRNLESKKSSPNNEEKWKAKIELLETKLQASRDMSVQDKDKVQELLDTLNKKEEELSDLGLNNRILEKDIKAAKDTQSFLRERNKEVRDELKKTQDELAKKTQEGEKLTKKMQETEDQIKLQSTSHKTELSIVEEKLKKANEKISSSTELQKSLRNTENDCENYKTLNKDLESKLKRLENEKESLKKYELSLKSDIQDLKEKLSTSENNIATLKEICEDQDKQLALIDTFEAKLTENKNERDELEKKIEKLNADVKTARAGKNEEVSLRLFQERRVKETEDRLKSAEQEHDQQLSVLQEQTTKYNDEKLALQDQQSEMKKELDEITSEYADLERQLSNIEGSNEQLQNEVSGHIAHIHSLKESNFVLTQGIEEAINKGEMYKLKIQELEGDLKHQQAISEDSKIRLTETINQQTKLIDFLQAKNENPPKKKRNILKIFGSSNHNEKENKGGNFSVPHQYRDLQELLAQECVQTKTLSMQLEKANSEISVLKSQVNLVTTQSKMKLPESTIVPSTPKVRQALKNLADSPSVQSSSTKKRMRHAIPHRWQSNLVMHGSRCCGCLDSIPFARKAMKCQECGLVAHSKCSSGLQSTCGLPAAYAHHYIEKCDSSDIQQGWLKIRNATSRSNKSSWVKLYACLEGTQLLIYECEPMSNTIPVNKVLLDKKTYSVAITNAVNNSEVNDTCETDTPYIFKIEKGCRAEEPPIYIMTKNFEEKRMWITALENILNKFSLDETVEDGSQGFISSRSVVLLPKDQPLNINTVICIGKVSKYFTLSLWMNFGIV